RVRRLFPIVPSSRVLSSRGGSPLHLRWSGVHCSDSAPAGWKPPPLPTRSSQSPGFSCFLHNYRFINDLGENRASPTHSPLPLVVPAPLCDPKTGAAKLVD